MGEQAAQAPVRAEHTEVGERAGVQAGSGRGRGGQGPHRRSPLVLPELAAVEDGLGARRDRFGGVRVIGEAAGADPLVGELRISPPTANKLIQRHHVDPEDVRPELVGVEGLTYAENIHPIYGWRALVIIQIRSQRVLVVLFPTEDPHAWNLGSAYPIR